MYNVQIRNYQLFNGDILLCCNILEFGSTRGAAPSIGEVSVISSTGGHQRSASPDRDSQSASMLALAGASLTGSVGSSHPLSHNKYVFFP